MTVVTPLYGHDSFETAYLVEDYPYGRLRCKMWFWLESNNKGVRFVSRSENPKTGNLNKPHCGIYSKISGNMYLDENGHCTYAIVNEYSTPQEVYDFIKNFPNNHRMRDLTNWCKLKYAYERKCVDNKATPYGRINDEDLHKYIEDMRTWLRAFNLTQNKPENSSL